jgi:hypothetical protein
MVPSRIRNAVSLLAILLSNPWLSSATRKAVRINTARVEIPRAVFLLVILAVIVVSYLARTKAKHFELG